MIPSRRLPEPIYPNQNSNNCFPLTLGSEEESFLKKSILEKGKNSVVWKVSTSWAPFPTQCTMGLPNDQLYKPHHSQQSFVGVPGLNSMAQAMVGAHMPQPGPFGPTPRLVIDLETDDYKLRGQKTSDFHKGDETQIFTTNTK